MNLHPTPACAVCGRPIPEGRAVGLNDRIVGADCFAEALRTFTFTPAEIVIELEPSMAPELAYSLGKTHVATIVAARRKAKKR